MGNVELIELERASETLQCPSCLTYISKGTTSCKCGKQYDPINVRWTGFEKHPKHWKPLIIVLHERNEVLILGNKTIIKPETQKEVQRKRTSVLRYGIGGGMTKFIEHLNLHTIAQMSGSSTSTLSRTSTLAMMHLIGRGHDITIWFIFEASTWTSKPDHCANALDTKKQTELLRVFSVLKDKEFLIFT